MKKHVYIFEIRSDQIQQHFKLGCILTKRIPEIKCDNGQAKKHPERGQAKKHPENGQA